MFGAVKSALSFCLQLAAGSPRFLIRPSKTTDLLRESVPVGLGRTEGSVFPRSLSLPRGPTQESRPSRRGFLSPRRAWLLIPCRWLARCESTYLGVQFPQLQPCAWLWVEIPQSFLALKCHPLPGLFRLVCITVCSLSTPGIFFCAPSHQLARSVFCAQWVGVRPGWPLMGQTWMRRAAGEPAQRRKLPVKPLPAHRSHSALQGKPGTSWTGLFQAHLSTLGESLLQKMVGYLNVLGRLTSLWWANCFDFVLFHQMKESVTLLCWWECKLGTAALEKHLVFLNF